jgi:hypothetical protein
MGRGEGDALLYQNRAKAETASRRLDQQQAELSDFVRVVYEKHAPDSLFAAPRDPRFLSRCIEIANELATNFSDKPFKSPVPSVFCTVDLTVPLYHPADIAGDGIAKLEVAHALNMRCR